MYVTGNLPAYALKKIRYLWLWEEPPIKSTQDKRFLYQIIETITLSPQPDILLVKKWSRYGCTQIQKMNSNDEACSGWNWTESRHFHQVIHCHGNWFPK